MSFNILLPRAESPGFHAYFNGKHTTANTIFLFVNFLLMFVMLVYFCYFWLIYPIFIFYLLRKRHVQNIQENKILFSFGI